MPERSETVASCHACGKPMDVTALAPFARVVCPACGGETRVKLEFGPYTLTRRHAVGGMSMVFVAQDNTLHREVALKILSEEFSADERRIAAFEEEARITASFSHPNVVRVFTTGKAFGRLYIAMELVPGGHFEHQIRERGRIPEQELLPLAIEVAEGLKAAHAAGLIHRDIKPGNILLDADHHAKIVDFGLALVTQGGKAQAAELWATPYYVPPETIEGAPEDFRSDIYAFGATLYHALAGVPSCGEESMATDVLRLAKRRVVSLATLHPALSVHVCQIVARAMAHDPGDRFESYDEMIAQLNTAQKRWKSGTAVTIEARDHLAKRRARKQRGERAVLAMAALVLLGSTVAGIWWVSRDEPREATSVPVIFDGPAVVPELPVAGATEIAKSYREARAAVEAGEYEKAGAGFSRLLENDGVQEPTRSWAGVEAVIASYLAGDGSEAKTRAQAAAEHLKSVDAASWAGEILPGTLGALPALPAISPAQIVPERTEATTVMAWMLAGLKDWEQGLTGEAARFFSAVAGARITGDDGGLAIYQKLASGYLADQQTLSLPVFQALPADAAACEAAVSELDSLLGGLHSRGRARFNIRAWQLDLKRHAKLLRTKPASGSGETSSWDVGAILAKLREFAAADRVADAISYLRALPAGSREPEKASLLAVTTGAGEFLADLKTGLAQGPLNGGFALKSAGIARQISTDGEGRIRIVDGEGKIRNIAWEELPADTLIGCHRLLVRNVADETERLKRNERAICYDWIAGNRERARLAAAQLGQGVPAFKERWERVFKDLPE